MLGSPALHPLGCWEQAPGRRSRARASAGPPRAWPRSGAPCWSSAATTCRVPCARRVGSTVCLSMVGCCARCKRVQIRGRDGKASDDWTTLRAEAVAVVSISTQYRNSSRHHCYTPPTPTPSQSSCVNFRRDVAIFRGTIFVAERTRCKGRPRQQAWRTTSMSQRAACCPALQVEAATSYPHRMRASGQPCSHGGRLGWRRPSREKKIGERATGE